MEEDKVKEKEVTVIPRLNDEFLDVLVEVGKVIGWGLDYTEVGNFIRECFGLAGKVPPDLTPYE